MPDTKKPPAIDALAKEIGERIAKARNGLGWSQQALQAHTRIVDPENKGVSRAVLSLYETGVNKPGARELRLLCDALKVTPNWLLYGTDTPASAIQPSLEFMRDNDLKLSTRLAFAMLAIDPKEREAIATVVFSLLEKQLGDIKLSSLMTMASMLHDGLQKEILQVCGEDAKDLPIKVLIDRFIAAMTDGAYSNFGTLRPVMPEEDMFDFDPEKVPPPRKL